MGIWRSGLNALGLIMVAAAAVASGQGKMPLDQAMQREVQPNPSLTAYQNGIRDEAHRRSLELRQLDAEVTIRGAIAETILEMQFAGLKGDQTEAWLHIDLPEGAIVTGYALDIDGLMIDGSLVEAPRARAGYERQVRGRIDPGLGEVDKQGGFRVRVFPVDGDKGRRIRLRFVAPVGDRFALPFDLGSRSGNWVVRVNGLADGASASIGARRLRPTGDTASLSGKGALRGALTLKQSESAVIASRHPITGESYWQASGMLPPGQRAQGGTLRIYWDRSRSQKGASHGAALARVREAVAALAPTKIELVAFNSQGAERRALADVRELAAEVGKLRYAGATSYAPLVGDASADTCLLVSDGQVTLGDRADWSAPCRLFALASGDQADRPALAALAERSGGRLIEPGRTAVDWRASGVERVIDAAGHPVAFSLLPASAGRYRLMAANPSGGPLRVVINGASYPLAMPAVAREFAGEGALLAARQLTSLEGTGDREAFVALSRRYSVASPTLSFLVLDDPKDYVEAGVEPTATYPKLAEYRTAKAENDREAAEERAERFTELLSAWNEEVEWWKQDFDPKARPKKSDRGGTPAPPPPPPPAIAPAMVLPEVRNEPPPPPEPERDGPDEAQGYTVQGELNDLPSTVTSSADMGNIVVTGSRIPAQDISLVSNAWRPERDYLTAYDRDPTKFDRVFPEWEDKAGGVPSFYLDTADWLHRQGRADEAAEMLLSALDLPSANSITLGLVAARLQRWRQFDLAVALRERQLLVERDRPQVKRLLALALAARANADGPNARADLERAISLLADVALGPIDDRWEGIDIIALREANGLIPSLAALGGKVDLDPQLVKNLDSDVRVVIDWSTDATDLDLWVDEPNGERAIYSNARTAIGGRLSNDMTAGYGPEEYWLRRAPPGTFNVLTNNFASDRLDPNGRPRLNVRLIRDFGRPTEREVAVDLEMVPNEDDDADEVRIGTITIGASDASRGGD